jgi:transcriptional regulator with XRE-family HTH domain
MSSRLWHTWNVTDAESLGPRLRESRTAAKLPLREMERRSGLNSGYLSQLEQGKIIHPSATILRKVASAYELRLEDVLAWTGYAVESTEGLPPRQALALSTVASLGEPSESELEALRAIVKVLQDQRATSSADEAGSV